MTQNKSPDTPNRSSWKALCESDRAADLVDYSDDLRALLRVSGHAREHWPDAYREGLQVAIARKDLDGIAALGMVAAVQLGADGRHEDSLAAFDFAIEASRESPDAVATLASQRAVYAALAAEPELAIRSLELARAALNDASRERAACEFASCEAAVQLLTLRWRSDAPQIVASMRASGSGGFDWQSSALRTWLIDAMLAEGRSATAQPWISVLAAQARVELHPWRAADAESYRWSTMMARDPRSVAAADLPDFRRNFLPGWRLASLALRATLLLDDDERTRVAVARLDDLSETMNAHFRRVSGYFGAFTDAYTGSGPSALQLLAEPPESVTLATLGAAMAGMEAASIASSRASADRWLAWSQRVLPQHVQSAPEWPVARARLEALLPTRLGNPREGARRMLRAVRWCDDHGFVIEGAIARVQLYELWAHQHRSVAVPRPLQLRDEGVHTLREAGIEPTRPAYAASSAARSAPDSGLGVALTRRECEVLEALALGLTYREAAEGMGVSWRTVQSHAHNAYTKLSARSRIEAIATATKLGLIEPPNWIRADGLQ